MSTISQLLVVFIVHSALLVAAQTDAKKGGGRPRQPPQAALDACATLTSGADCSFTGKHGLKSGACISPPGKPLACKPAPPQQAPAPPQQTPVPPQQALDACAALTSGADCSFTGKHGLVAGACISPPGKPLACKPSASAEAVQACASKHEGAGCQYTSIRSGKSKDHSGQCLEQQHEGANMGCDNPEEDEHS